MTTIPPAINSTIHPNTIQLTLSITCYIICIATIAMLVFIKKTVADHNRMVNISLAIMITACVLIITGAAIYHLSGSMSAEPIASYGSRDLT